MTTHDKASQDFMHINCFEKELKDNFIKPFYKEKITVSLIRFKEEKDVIKIVYTIYEQRGRSFIRIKNIPFIYLNEEIKFFNYIPEWEHYKTELDILISNQMVELDVQNPIVFGNLKIYIENTFIYDTDCGKISKVEFDIIIENKVLGFVVSSLNDSKTFFAMLDIEFDQASKKVFNKPYKSLTLEEKQLLSMYLN